MPKTFYFSSIAIKPIPVSVFVGSAQILRALLRQNRAEIPSKKDENGEQILKAKVLFRPGVSLASLKTATK